MMTKSRPSHNAILRKISAITLFLFLGVAFTFSQENVLNKNTSYFENGWWYPILQKHKIDLKQFNYKNAFNVGENDSINNLWLELGNSDSLYNRNITFKNAIFISKGVNNTYWIVTSESASHDYEKNLVESTNGKMESFSFKSASIIPIQSFTYQEFNLNSKANKITVTSDSLYYKY